VSDHAASPENLDTLLDRIRQRVEERQDRLAIADLSRAAAQLRETTNGVGAALSSILDQRDLKTPRGRRSGDGDAIDPLTRFAIGRGTDKWGPHFYTPVYHELFSSLRRLPIRLLEIGVGGHGSAVTGGASLLMWADYFPRARIVGIDIAEKRLDVHPRVTVLQGSQDDSAFLARVVEEHGPFDIVIDDGSHVPKQVAASFEMLFPTLADSGFYVIEDVQTAFWPDFGGTPADGAETMALARVALHAINHAEINVIDTGWTPPAFAVAIRSVRAFHNLLVFQKGDNREPSTRRFDPDNAHVVRALEVMEHELARQPTPEGLTQLARTYRLAKRHDRSLEVAARGLEQWPDHVPLLMIAAKAAKRTGNDALRQQYLQRLSDVAGDDPQVRELLRNDT
jgi:hypothetical protein